MDFVSLYNFIWHYFRYSNSCWVVLNSQVRWKSFCGVCCVVCVLCVCVNVSRSRLIKESKQKIRDKQWLEIQEGKRPLSGVVAIENSQNRQNRRDRPSLISPLDRSSARRSRGPDRVVQAPHPSVLPSRLFLRNRCEIVELYDPISSGRRVAQTRCPPIVPGFLLYTDFAREIETRSHCTRRNREGKKKIAAGNNCIVASRHSWNLHFSRFLSDRH